MSFDQVMNAFAPFKSLKQNLFCLFFEVQQEEEYANFREKKKLFCRKYAARGQIFRLFWMNSDKYKLNKFCPPNRRNDLCRFRFSESVQQREKRRIEATFGMLCGICSKFGFCCYLHTSAVLYVGPAPVFPCFIILFIKTIEWWFFIPPSVSTTENHGNNY